MALGDWKLPAQVQPDPQDYAYDLDRALAAMVGVRAQVPDDAFTADVLGTERAGNGVLIRKDGLVLTIGYLVTEAETIWLELSDGRTVPGHPLAYDQTTGFGLVQALARLDMPVLAFGSSSSATVGESVVMAGHGGRERSLAATPVARPGFAGYWEYVLDEALFTGPAHPHWGGAALIGPKGDLLGIGSLQLQGAVRGQAATLNMVVPIDLLKPILDDMLTTGRTKAEPRPWLGLYAAEMENKIAVIGLADGGPADKAGVQEGDLVLAAGGRAVGNLASFFRRIWGLGGAGVAVPLTLHREGRTFDVTLKSADRNSFLKTPRMH